MLKNYFVIAWRNLTRDKTFSILNLVGIAFGLCCFLLISMFGVQKCSDDRYNRRAQDIYRVNMNARWGGTLTVDG